MHEITKNDQEILRELSKEVAEIGANPVQKEKERLWQKSNNLQSEKPMILISEIPWHEMNVNDELTLKTTTEWSRAQEYELRKSIYYWKHMAVDRIFDPFLMSPLAIHDSGFGICEETDVISKDLNSTIVSRHFHIQISEEEDIEKIKYPIITHDEKSSKEHLELMKDIYGDILPIEQKGQSGFWFAPWDELIRWWGVEEALTDLYVRPELIHKAMDRLVNAYLSRLDQFEQLNLLALNNTSGGTGSGGLAATDQLPLIDFNPNHVLAKDIWGCSTAQIFSEVSPAMHEEFAINYEIRWLERFGLNYYGCCEPLHRKIDILKKIPNLRKISMSRWINIDEAVENVGKDFVFSYKPNPGIFATDNFDLEAGKKELEHILDKAKVKGCNVEIIMKDLSTINYKPQNLWAWAKMATELAQNYV